MWLCRVRFVQNIVLLSSSTEDMNLESLAFRRAEVAAVRYCQHRVEQQKKHLSAYAMVCLLCRVDPMATCFPFQTWDNMTYRNDVCHGDEGNACATQQILMVVCHGQQLDACIVCHGQKSICMNCILHYPNIRFTYDMHMYCLMLNVIPKA